MTKLALLVVETIVLLVVLELGLRLTVPSQTDVPHLRVSPHGFYTWYPGDRFTYHNLPNVVPPEAEVRINEHGLRGPSLPAKKPAGETRVLVVGDSYTAGVQLPEERIFTTVMARALDADGSADRYRVVNAGVNGAGTAHELLYFLYAGSTLDPDVVVLQYAFNDLDDSVKHGGFQLTHDGVELAESLRNPPPWRGPVLAVRDAVANRSLAFYLLYKAATALAANLGGGAAHAESLATSAPADTGVLLVQRLAARLIGAANALGAPVIIVMIPAPIHLSGGDPQYAAVAAALRALVDGTRNRLIVADATLRESESRGEPVYLAHDGHLSERGHALVGALLAAAVKDVRGPASASVAGYEHAS